MKLRIQADSLRIRLTQTEVAQLAGGNAVTQATSFSPTAQLITSVETSASASAASARLEGSQLAIVLPLEPVRRWAHSEQVSIPAEQRIDDKRSLSILIEKDFECLHHTEENQDAFPNPLKRSMHQ